MRKMLIGLGGHPSSGKDTVAAYLVEKHGFNHVSTSDMIRFYMAERDMGPQDRDSLRVIANTLREEHGADYFARLALQNDAEYLVVSGLRAIAEVETVKKAGGKILAITAPIEARYKRVTERGRASDAVTFEEFKLQEEKEASNTNPEAQNVSGVIAMADTVINNSGTLEDLQKEVDKFLQKS